jgi:Zn-dependent protease with chaperone function
MIAARSSPSSRQDAALTGLLAGTWALAFLTLFGVEARSLLYLRNESLLALTLPALLAILPFMMRRELLRRLMFPRIPVQGGGALRRPHENAHQVARDYIVRRARDLGIDDTIRVLRKPNSANETNACVWPSRRTQFLSLTSKVETLLGAGRRGDRLRMEEFKFLVDHELGHIWHRDTGPLLLVRSILWCTVMLIPVKLGVWYAMNWRFLIVDFARIFPPLTDGSGLLSGLKPPPFSVGAAVFVLYTSIGLTVLWLFARTVARRREYLADRFAFVNAEDCSQAAIALAELLKGPAPRAVAAPSFLGGLTSHPSKEARLAQMMKPAESGQSSFEIIVTTLSTIVIGRMALAETTGVAVLDPAFLFKVGLSLPYTALVSFLLCCLVSGRSEQGERRYSIYNALKVVAWSALFSFGLVGIAATLFLLVRSADPVAAQAQQIELIEWSFLFLSLPIVTASYAGAHLGAGSVSLSDYWGTLARQTVGLAMGTLMLVAAAALISPVLWHWRDQQNGAVRNALYEKLEQAQACEDDRGAAQNRREECARAAAEIRQTIGFVDTQFINYRFRPPEAWIFLWQQPFRRPARWT